MELIERSFLVVLLAVLYNGGSNLQVRPSVVLSVMWNKGVKVVICSNFP